MSKYTEFPNGVSSQGIPMPQGIIGTGSHYFVDPANGSDGNSGKNIDNAFKTLGQAKAAVSATDVVYIVGGASGLSETIDWDVNYTSIIGVASPVFNSRARISAPSGGADSWFTISADGCIVSNMRVGTFEDININALVSGDRNYFYNVAFQGGGDATAADDANMRSLKLTGSENRFKECTIGLDTIARANVASAELELSGGAARNSFEDVLFTKQADGAGNLFVKTVGTSAVDRWTKFHNCTYYSFWTNDSDKITAAFDVSSQTSTGHFIMSGRQILIGADDWEGTASNKLYFEPYSATTSAVGLAINNA